MSWQSATTQRAAARKEEQLGHRRALEDLVRANDVNRIKSTMAATYPASELTAALDHLTRGAFGKVVVSF